MRVTVQVGLGFALMGGLLMVACGDESRADRAIDSPVGSGGMATPARGGAPGAAGIGGAPGTGGALGTGGARPSGGESPPPPAGAIQSERAALGWPTVDKSADGPLAGGRRRRRRDGRALRRPRLLEHRPAARRDREQRDGDVRARRGAHLLARAGRDRDQRDLGGVHPAPHGNAVGGARHPTRLRRRRVRRLRARQSRAAGGTERLCAELPAAGPDARRGRDVLRSGGQSERRRLRRRPRLDASRTSRRRSGSGARRPSSGGPTGFTAGERRPRSVMPYGPIYVSGPAGDVDGDGYADFLFKTRFTPTTYLGGAAGISEGPPAAAEGSQSFYAFGADYDGDGFADAASMTNGDPSLFVTRGEPAGFDPSMVHDAHAAAAAIGWPARDGRRQRRRLRRPGGRHRHGRDADPRGLGGGPRRDADPEPLRLVWVRICRSRPAISTATGSRISSTQAGMRRGRLLSSTTGRRQASRTRSRRCRSPRRRPSALTRISDVNGDGFEDVTAELFEFVTDANWDADRPHDGVPSAARRVRGADAGAVTTAGVTVGLALTFAGGRGRGRPPPGSPAARGAS